MKDGRQGVAGPDGPDPHTRTDPRYKGEGTYTVHQVSYLQSSTYYKLYPAVLELRSEASEGG